LNEYESKGYPVIPVLLSGAPEGLKLRTFLKGYKWVDFRRKDLDPLKQLIWGITGERQ
jgi:hypothetical protein